MHCIAIYGGGGGVQVIVPVQSQRWEARRPQGCWQSACQWCSHAASKHLLEDRHQGILIHKLQIFLLHKFINTMPNLLTSPPVMIMIKEVIWLSPSICQRRASSIVEMRVSLKSLKPVSMTSWSSLCGPGGLCARWSSCMSRSDWASCTGTSGGGDQLRVSLASLLLIWSLRMIIVYRTGWPLSV